ncbi:MAG: duf1446 domain-containing protein [Lasallia pustulata]|uniref:Duf1446 domain-containing protein n=1 Tax=Lasallia pustulata TaxID=136370 RepID=A0A5M8PSJ5_9LECA|nr:MAG: duf1446 domain-containing protein [Lasallia pustulata]
MTSSNELGGAFGQDVRLRRQQEFGQRPVRIANCSGYKSDPSWQMLRQATLGDVDFITGDYLAEMNMAENAEAFSQGKHDGFEPTAWQGLQESIEVIASRGIKVVINGGALNPQGLAEKTFALIEERGLDLRVAFITGDDLLPELGPNVASLKKHLPKHLDSLNPSITLPPNTEAFLQNDSLPLVSANAYLGARAIVQGLRLGADIIVAGRVSDASPVIGAAWYWHSWSETDYDRLAGALIAGHLIECSAYVTGGNFSGFTEYDLDLFIEPGFPIAEVAADGSCIITKHENTGGLVNEDTVKCQFLYELQGNIYLHSDVTAYLDSVEIKSVGKDRVQVSGIIGKPPPPTTKAAIFYQGGYQSQILLNAAGYGTNEKWQLLERQIRRSPKASKFLPELDVLEFQIVGIPDQNSTSILRSTTYCRVFAQAPTPAPLLTLLSAFSDIALCHFSGFHCALDMRTALPLPFLSYYPALYPQSSLFETLHLLPSSPTPANPSPSSSPTRPATPQPTPPLSPAPLLQHPVPLPLSSFGPTTRLRLGDVALARSGDKAGNLNLGLFVRTAPLWAWFRNWMDAERMTGLLGRLGEEWKQEYKVERVQFDGIRAVHFVVYGWLGRGVGGGSRLDCLGKGVADWVRGRGVDVPVGVLG